MKIKIRRYYGRHPKIGIWYDFTLIPIISIGRVCDFITEKPICVVFIKIFLWSIEINNNKSY